MSASHGASGRSVGCSTIVASPPQEVVNLERASMRFAQVFGVGTRLWVFSPSMEFLGFVAGVRHLAAAWAIAAGSGVANPKIVPDIFHLLERRRQPR